MDKNNRHSSSVSGAGLSGSLRHLSALTEGDHALLGGLSAWVQSVSLGQPDQIAKEFIRQILTVSHQGKNVRTQLRQLEILYKGALPHLCELELLLDQGALPLSTAHRKAATAIDSMLKAFVQSYLELAQTLSGKWFRMLHARQQRLAALHAAQLIHRRAHIAYRVYASGSAQRWQQLRSLLQMTEEANQERLDEDVVHTTEALKRQVAQSCLVALSDPSSLSEQDLTRVNLYAERYAYLVKISSKAHEEDGPGRFILSDSAKGPRKFKPENIDTSRYHYLDTRPLLQKLAEHIRGMQAGALPSQLGLPGGVNDPSYLALLMRCHEQWSEPRKRQHPRKGVRPKADLVSGFDAVFHAISQQSPVPAAIAPTQQPASSEWDIVDQSEGGFGLRFVSGHPGSIGIGEVVALRFKEKSSFAVCITRRARSISGSEFEIGLELLAERALATVLSSEQNAVRPAILLPSLNNGHNSPALLIPESRLPQQRVELTVRSRGTPVRLRATTALEHLNDCELLAMQRAPN